MIISHLHKFIFIKPTKVAGTSIEVALARHCGAEDILTSITKYSPSFDDDSYIHQSQNDVGFHNHMSPSEIKDILDPKVWNSYFKFTVVRNPWDQVVSRFCWEKSFVKFKIRRNLRRVGRSPFRIEGYKKMVNLIVQLMRLRSFENFVGKFEPEWTNTRFYFDANGNPICDYFIRYENLQADYGNVCNRLGIQTEKLLKLKSKSRNHRLHYSQYYNDRTRLLVANLFKREIEFFDYRFYP